jgi:Flp pilus assembly protein TadG
VNAVNDAQQLPRGGGVPTNSGGRDRSALARRLPAQALVEFALVGSLVALLLVGASDLPRVFYYDVVVSGAAAQGARAAATGAPDADVIAAAQNSAPGWIASALAVTVAPVASARTSGTTPVWTTVTVTYQFTPVTLFASRLLGSSSTVTRRASQRMQTSCVLADGTPCS